MTTTQLTPSARRRGIRLIPCLVAVLATVVCAVITWTFCVALVGVDLTVGTGNQTRIIGVVDVVVAALVAALAGFVAVALLQRVTGQARRSWTIVAVVAALASLLGPTSATTTSAMWALISLHCVVAAVIIASGYRMARGVA
ncbi:DUF6069 family protein [Arsenicicoccus piscis]|uniref:Uncharacterized protein n=1 Tax=Arsenicicoccus piscis TaxID=673954 RepID=A0ABQ6HMH1_9MICO|nr:DUF6069 family protein [Arsenicicoccus piscis]MCH8628999.1 DUF6069 family protein [Arsenicicoccus piscis]GMA19615.1 hypothetical protein GCM10025862_16360 [Arsenicicoccus piscis]